MPKFWKKADNEARKNLEQKMYLARERPDELFDISSCQLDEVPRGTFSLIKVLQKKHLLLHNNRLETLSSGGSLADLSALTFIDLSDNRIKSLPDNIGLLVALKGLNVSRNMLKDIPDSMKCLKHLVSLKLNSNRIKELAGVIGSLRNLRELLLDDNPLKRLPNEVRFLTNLTALSLPSADMVSPPSDVCQQGVSAIIAYLSQGVSPDGNSESDSRQDNSRQSVSHNDDELSSLTGSVNYPTLPLMPNRMQSSDLVRNLDDTDRTHQELTVKAMLARQKVLSQLAEEDARLHADLVALQRERDQQHNQLVSTLITAEDSAAQVIKQLLSAEQNRRYVDDADTNPLLELPDEATIKLRRQEVLASMRDMLTATDDAYTDYIVQRDSAKQAALSLSTLDTKGVSKVLADKQRDRDRLTSQISAEESVQREAFLRLQSQQDERFCRLLHDISLVEWELYRLTLAEQERRAAHTEVNQRGLDGRRAELVDLLRQLIDQRKRREAELQRYLVELEERRCQDQMDYWLVQYQRLLDSKPAQLNQPVEDRVRSILLRVGGLDFEPNFRYHQITFDRLVLMSDEDLQRIGVYTMGIRRGILDAVAEQFLTEKLAISKPAKPEPSAPVEPASIKPSAPPEVVARVLKECCICLAAQCDTIFMQCGHVCTCNQCAHLVSLCPLCRGEIVQRIHLQSQLS